MARWSKSGIGIRARSPIGQAQIFLSICSPIKLETNRPARLGLEKIGPGKIYPNYGAHSDKLTLGLHDSNEKFHFQT